MSRARSQQPEERTLCIVKPAAYRHREAIVGALLSADFQILHRRETTLTRAQATRLYVQHADASFFEKLLDSIVAGPICVLFLQRRDAIAELRHIVGPTDPAVAKQVNPDCLRALYGTSALDNAIHASKNKAEAEREEDVIFRRKKRCMILFGPPASGKGTQCELIVSAYGLVHLSTGDLLRAHVKNGTDIGREIKSYLDSGRLVPDALITRLTLERLAQADCEEKGWILDGFPRTPTQAQSLIDAGIDVNRFVVLAADGDALIARVGGRRFDPKTGATYHVRYNPPPPGIVADRCVIRSDDTPEVMRARLRTYDATVAEVVKQFHDICTVQSDLPIYTVFANIVRCIEAEGSRPTVQIRQKSSVHAKRLLASKL